MKLEETVNLINYINGLDPMFTVNPARIEAWQSFLPPHITYRQARLAIDNHYQHARTSIKPKDLLDYINSTNPQIQQPYQYGMRPLCGNCEQGYVRHPQPPNKHGHVFYHVDLCDCQWIGAPRLGPQHEDNF